MRYALSTFDRLMNFLIMVWAIIVCLPLFVHPRLVFNACKHGFSNKEVIIDRVAVLEFIEKLRILKRFYSCLTIGFFLYWFFIMVDYI